MVTTLRTGYTTGAYAAATTLAAWRCLCGRRNGARVSLLFPDGQSRRINVDGWERSNTAAAMAWAIKDAGDDIDCTHGARVESRLSRCTAADIETADHVVSCGEATLVLRGGAGVGLVTGPGLDVEPGKWAINPVPRTMISENLLRADLGTECGHWLVELSIANGDALARKTLNPTLGVEGGLSVLGSSGIVIPCSNAAYISTIQILLRGAKRAGSNTAVLVTGGRTHRAARERFPDLPEVAFVRIGDFIKESCQAVSELKLAKLIVCCMPGKLAKYALGHAYTHAHRVALSTRDVAAALDAGGASRVAVDICRQSRTMREGLLQLAVDDRREAIQILSGRALQVIGGWASGTEPVLHVLSFDGSQWWE
jgi:cobalt-precorrin-5B (C1)-methyltransferase